MIKLSHIIIDRSWQSNPFYLSWSKLIVLRWGKCWSFLTVYSSPLLTSQLGVYLAVNDKINMQHANSSIFAGRKKIVNKNFGASAFCYMTSFCQIMKVYCNNANFYYFIGNICNGCLLTMFIVNIVSLNFKHCQCTCSFYFAAFILT